MNNPGRVDRPHRQTRNGSAYVADDGPADSAHPDSFDSNETPVEEPPTDYDQGEMYYGEGEDE